MEKNHQLKYKFECGLCPTRIWEQKGRKVVKSPEYHEVEVKLSDLTSMAVGVCSKHVKPKKLEFTSMMEKCKQGWIEEVAFGLGNAAWVQDKGLSLEIVGMKP